LTRRRKITRSKYDLPDHVRKAFEGKIYLNLAQLAAALGYSPRTLVRFCESGVLNFHQRGVGTSSRHRAFTRADVEAFWNQTERMDLDALNTRRSEARERNAAGKAAR